MSTSQLTILQVNDTHAYLQQHPELFWEKGKFIYRQAGGYARMAALIGQIREESAGSCLLLDNGDTLHGTYPAVETQGKALTPLLNQMKFDAMTAHWEFAYGPQVLLERCRELDYPLLAVNIKDKASGERSFQGSRVVEAGRLRVGVIGIASNIVDKSMPASFSEGLCFTSGREELPDEIERLRSQDKVDLIVVLSHLGLPQDIQIIKETPHIDILLSGHTHNRLYKPIVQGHTLVIQSGSHGSFIGRLDVDVEGNRIRQFQHHLIEVAESVTPDPKMEEMVNAAVAPFGDMLGETVGESEIALHRNLNLEAPMDNLLLEALLHTSGAMIAFSNGWRYGVPILPGRITQNDLYNIIPSNPPVSMVEMTGEEILDMVEKNLESTYSHDPFGQMGGYAKRMMGLRVYFKVENPYPHRIQKVFIGERDLEPTRYYQTVFVTEQGVPQRYGMNRRNLELRAVDALKAFLREKGPYRGEMRHPLVMV